MQILNTVKECFRNYLRKYNPELLFKINYYRAQGRWLNTKQPQTLYDKIAYQMFHTDTSIWSELADKVRVRDYITSLGYGGYLPKLYGVYKRAEEINYESLPQQFILKTNNASATNIVVFDKSQLDYNHTNKQLDKWLKIPYGYLTCQPHYSKIEPRILAEELLIDDQTTRQGKSLIDYKFFCINGVPEYVMVMSDRIQNTHEMKCMVFDMSWEKCPEYVNVLNHEPIENMSVPGSFEKMKSLANIFAKDFPFVRVDFYEINGKPILGELTFTPGLSAITQSMINTLGKKIKL